MICSPWIFTTHKCNMNCDYCHVSGKETMNNDVYNQVEKIIDKISPIRISGGEPLIVFDNWKYFAKKYKNAEVLTNFRYIPNGYFDFNFRTSISIDGYGAKILNKELKNNIKKLKIQPWIMTTLKNQDIAEIADYVSKNSYGWAISTDYFSKEIDLKNVIPVIKESIKILKKNNYNMNDIIFNNIRKNKMIGCTAGDYMIAIDTDGKIYNCQTEIGKESIGDIWNGYKKQKCNKLKQECKDCIINNYCNGWCSLHHNTYNDICKLMKYFVWEAYYAE